MILAPHQKSRKPQGSLFVISGPSGVGKGTLVCAALKGASDMDLSVSATTRAPRKGEVEGVTYHFVTPQEFDELVQSNEFLEWAEVHGQRYGTLLGEVRKVLDEGRDVILEIDPQGREQVAQLIPETFSIFIAPPSLEALKQRLEYRATESPESITQRLHAAEVEMNAQDRYNVVIINDDLDKATQELLEHISNRRAERL